MNKKIDKNTNNITWRKVAWVTVASVWLAFTVTVTSASVWAAEKLPTAKPEAESCQLNLP